ncbi:aromatic amino acid lyase [Streptomyces sp. SID13031]|uniref:aromatic amino acid lyase n=1 Tax=Streptomyces sp. SID13031 TaxID=2706046 RepID=UPI0019410E2E|nr:aromatic amino acid lyase [Streptomyces sp. SID13031]
MLINDATDLGPRQLTDPEPLELSRELLDRLNTTRQAVLSALTTGDPVYGVNTGMGAMSNVRLTEPEQRIHQHNLLLARAAGGEPWLPALEARAVLVARLKTFLSGDAAVSPELCLQLVALLNSGLTPAIPTRGAGSAGEIIPLAHAFGPLIGIGSYLVPPASTSAPAVFAADGVLPAFELGPKEGISLLAGIPGAAGRAWLQVEVVRRLADNLGLIAAGAIAVVGARRDPYNPLCGRGG